MKRHHILITLIATVFPLCLTGCGTGQKESDGRLVVERSQKENTTIVRNVSGSVWSKPVELVEQVRIGAADGPDHQLFGEIAGLTFTPERIYVLDYKLTTVRAYDHSGRYLFEVGREGQGPGEFEMATSIAVNPLKGHLYVRDDYLGRIAVFTLEGEFLDFWQINTTYSHFNPMLIVNSGELYTMVLAVSSFPNFRESIVGFGSEGSLGDTLLAPLFDLVDENLMAYNEEGLPLMSRQVPFQARPRWTWNPSLDLISGDGRKYRLTIDHRNGSRTIIERNVDPVQIRAEESSWWRRKTVAEMQRIQSGWVWNGPGMPARKSFLWKLFTDRIGRIWVVRQGPGVHREGCAEDPGETSEWSLNPCWVDSYLMEVFQPTGEYLGSVSIPEGIQFHPLPYIDGDYMLAAVTDEFDVPYVVLYRIQY